MSATQNREKEKMQQSKEIFQKALDTKLGKEYNPFNKSTKGTKHGNR